MKWGWWTQASDVQLSSQQFRVYRRLKSMPELAFQARTYPKTIYGQQKGNAKTRGVRWELTFEEWWTIWQDSGRWEQRGRRHGEYCMARNNDSGPYSKDNVSIVLVEDNHKERTPNNSGKWIGKRHTEESKLKMSVARKMRF